MSSSAKEESLEDGLKNLNLTNEELTKFEKAFKDPEFLKLFEEYAREVSDPKLKAETDQYLRQLEEQGRAEDVYGKGVQLITPQAAMVLKSKVVAAQDTPAEGPGGPAGAADGSSSSGGGKKGSLQVGQKVFINICTSDKVDRYSLKESKDASGRPGRQLSIPLLMGPVRQGTDKQGQPAPVYDMVVHPEMVEFAGRSAQVMASLAETALEHVEKLSHCRLSRGWRRLNLRFKATEGCSEPPVQCIRTENGGDQVGGRLRPRSDVPGLDVPGAKTAPLQPAAAAAAAATTPAAAGPQPAAGSPAGGGEGASKGPASRSTFSFDKARDKMSKQQPEVKDPAQAGYRHPDGAVTPEWVLVRRGQADLAAAWKDAGRGLALGPEVPKELLLRVTLPDVASAAAVDLDVGERRLTLKVPGRYLLDAPLPYAVDESKGKAKFDKARKQLEITLPVVPPPPPPRPPVAAAAAAAAPVQELPGEGAALAEEEDPCSASATVYDAAPGADAPTSAGPASECGFVDAKEVIGAAETPEGHDVTGRAAGASTSGGEGEQRQERQEHEVAVGPAAQEPMTENERKWRELHARRAEEEEEVVVTAADAAAGSAAAATSPTPGESGDGGPGDTSRAAAAAAATPATGGATAASTAALEPEPRVLLQPRLKQDVWMELD